MSVPSARSQGGAEAADGAAARTLTARDRAHLARALALAVARGTTAHPNPAVGCVLVHGGVVVAEGATSPVGGPHAEAAALRAAGAAAHGATAYVTLEPCAHHGRTPPCADALVAAGVARVVMAHADPSPLAGGGAARLAAAGITVDGPLPAADPLHRAVAAQLGGFLHVVALGRPHVTLKLAQTLAGGLDAPDGGRLVTGAAARRAVHRLRADADAVLVGSGTVHADDPRLDVREVPVERQPLPVVLDTTASIAPDAQVVRSGGLVLVGTEADADRVRVLRAAGATVTGVATGPGGLELTAALAALVGQGVTRVLAEPGRRLAGALLREQLVDRLVVHVAAWDGHGPVRWAVPHGEGWTPQRVGGAGPDAIIELVRDADAPGPRREAA